MANITFSNNITLEYTVNNEYTLKHPKYPTLYLNDIERVADRIAHWTLVDKLSDVEEIQFKDFIGMKKDVLIEVKNFFEKAFNEHEKEMKKAAKKAVSKKKE